MIFLAIAALIIMSALGYDDGKFNVPDEIKPDGEADATVTPSTN